MHIAEPMFFYAGTKGDHRLGACRLQSSFSSHIETGHRHQRDVRVTRDPRSPMMRARLFTPDIPCPDIPCPSLGVRVRACVHVCVSVSLCACVCVCARVSV